MKGYLAPTANMVPVNPNNAQRKYRDRLFNQHFPFQSMICRSSLTMQVLYQTPDHTAQPKEKQVVELPKVDYVPMGKDVSNLPRYIFPIQAVLRC